MLHCELIPAAQASAKPQHLVIVLHGLGDSMDGYRWLPATLNVPHFSYLLVNAPDSYYGGYSWYDFAKDPRPGVERSREWLFQTIRAQKTPAENIFLFGFSQGCLMTLEVALRYPERLRGLVGISGYAFEPEEGITTLSPVAKEQAILMTHGLYDSLIPIDAVRQQVKLLQGAGLNIQWHELPKDHTIMGETEIAIIRQFMLERCQAT